MVTTFKKLNPMKSLLIIISCLCCLTLSAQNELNQEELIKLPFDELDTLYVQANTGDDFSSALTYTQALAEKAKGTYGEQDTLYGLRLITLGMNHYYFGKYQETLTNWTAAKAIFEKEWGTKHQEYISILGNIALLHYYLGNYKIAEQLTLEVKEIRANTVGRKHQEYAFLLNNLGLIYWTTSRYEEAEGAYLECKEIIEQTVGQDHPEYANVISNLASLYSRTGRYDEVEPLYLQTKEIMSIVHGKEHPYYIASLANLASLYANLKENEKAEALHLEAKAIRARTMGTNHPDYSIGLRSLGMLYMEMNQLEKAEKILIESKNLAEKSLGKTHPSHLSVMNSLAELYLKMEDLDKAYDFCWTVKNMSEEVLGKHHIVYFTSLEHLIHFFILKKDYPKAWDYAFESIAINASQTNVPKEINQAWVDELTGYSYFSKDIMDNILILMYEMLLREPSQESLEKQVLVSDLATQLLYKNRQEYIGEADQLRLLSESAFWTHTAIQTLSKMGEDAKYKKMAFRFAELNKSVLLYNSVQTERAYVFGGLPDSLVLKEKQLQEEKVNLKAALLEQLPSEDAKILQRDLASVNLDLNAFKEEIEKTYPKYSQLKYQQPSISLESLTKTLDSKTALLEYVVSDSFVHIFYVDQQSLDMYKVHISKETLTAVINKLHGVLSGYQFLNTEPRMSHQIYTEQAHWLYKELIEPVLRDKIGIKNLVIITDGELGHIPFETFLVEGANQEYDYKKLHYLINDYTVSYAYSASLFEDAIRNESTEGDKAHTFDGKQQMLALAGAYEPKTASELAYLLPTYQSLRKGLQPIKGAKKEVKLLANIFEGEFLWGEGANEHFFKEKAKDYGIIHLAMHGVLNRKSPALSALAFTENGDSLENNFLQAYEISQMDLNAKLVVLSACETGYGEFEEGNGIASLARSFMFAGVPSLIVSLWQVNDQSTAFIMESFYTNLKQGMNKAEALRLAKLDFLQQAQGISTHPAFWSPFIQLGSSAPLELREKSSQKGYYLALLGFLISIGGLFYWKKRKG
jgi:CHAT domain-containing protein